MSVGLTIHRAREFLAHADAENVRQSTKLTGKERAAAVGRNLFEAGLETLNSLPLTHQISGIASVAYGLGKIAYGGMQFFFGLGAAFAGGGGGKEGDAAASYVKSGFKTAALGAVAMIPAVGWIPNAAAAGLDVVDAVNSAIPATRNT